MISYIPAPSLQGGILKMKIKFGTIAPGMRADLILLEENPLDDISNAETITGVMVRGRWLSKSEIDARLAEIEAKHN